MTASCKTGSLSPIREGVDGPALSAGRAGDGLIHLFRRVETVEPSKAIDPSPIASTAFQSRGSAPQGIGGLDLGIAAGIALHRSSGRRPRLPVPVSTSTCMAAIVASDVSRSTLSPPHPGRDQIRRLGPLQHAAVDPFIGAGVNVADTQRIVVVRPVGVSLKQSCSSSGSCGIRRLHAFAMTQLAIRQTAHSVRWWPGSLQITGGDRAAGASPPSVPIDRPSIAVRRPARPVGPQVSPRRSQFPRTIGGL